MYGFRAKKTPLSYLIFILWYNTFKDALSDEDRGKIQVKESSQTFKFGEGKTFNSIGTITVPAYIGVKAVNITSELIDANIPMLLSKECMKKANTVLNFQRDEIIMLNQTLKLHATSSGHYTIPVINEQKSH